MITNRSKSILFIGNSFTYYNSLPRLLAQFAQKSGVANLKIAGVMRGGATLKALWKDASKVIRKGGWDYVVLQERGRLGGIRKNGAVHVGKPEEFFRYAGRFNKEAKKVGAKTILYCPAAWLKRSKSDQRKLNVAYEAIAKKLKNDVVPVGRACEAAMKKNKALDLYAKDGYHPNYLGTYLAACVFYKVLFKRRLVDLPQYSYVSNSERITRNPKKRRIDRDQAKLFWSIANRIK